MLYRVIDADDLPNLFAALSRDYEIVAPVESGKAFVFDTVDDFSRVRLDYPTTIASPKKYLLPSSETLFRFDTQANDIVETDVQVTPRVIFGVHTCDITAMNRLDLIFRYGDRPDPYYVARREATLIVGISCMPTDTCFCNLWGADEVRSGYDLFLQDIGGRYVVSMSGVDAANALEAACSPREATDEDRVAFRAVTRRRQAAFNPDIPEIQEVAMLMDTFHEDPFWDELGGRCLSCTACSSVCPTCFCFDIYDELDPDGRNGSRIRTWDACTNPQFSLVAGRHNFRPDGPSRVQHRMYHKLNGFLATHDHMLCVGCGRCVKACKADINPIEVLKFFERKGA